MLRAFRVLNDASFDERHDLWQLWRTAMGTLEKKLERILRNRFDDIEIRFDHEKGERISGSLISRKFSRMSHLTR